MIAECAQFDVTLINELFDRLVKNPKPLIEEQKSSESSVFDTVEPE